MRLARILAAVAALAAIGLSVLATGVALSADLDGSGARKKRVGHYHRVYKPAPKYVFDPDPYAYQYEPRGYYPYYAAGYWRPTAYVKARERVHYNVWNTQPPVYSYYRSWGYPLKYWPHKAWHDAYFGRHRPWHY